MPDDILMRTFRQMKKFSLVSNIAALTFKKKEGLSHLSPYLRTALADPGEYFPRVCIPFFVRICQLCTGSDTVINGKKHEKKSVIL